MRFSTNIWLWVAVVAASLHEMEHLFLGSIYFFERVQVFNHLAVLWGTTVAGNIVTAHPLGAETVATTFYEAGGKQGIMGQSGLVEQVLFGSTGRFLFRPFLHFGYNSLVVIPTTIAFLSQVRHAYDEYLAKVLPSLTEEQLVTTTTKLSELKFPRGAVITREGEPADRFYILTHGEAEVLHTTGDGHERVVSKIGPGQYFGEIGLMQGGQRTATVRALTDVTAMSLDRETFGSLMTQSEISRGELERVVRQRLAQSS
jgi:CRP-like cAMP-binding protein